MKDKLSSFERGKHMDSYGVKIIKGDIVEHTYRYYAGHGNVGQETEIVLIENVNNLPFDDSSVFAEVLGNIKDSPELKEKITSGRKY